MHEIKDIAKIAHEVNNAYCKAIGHPVQPKWDDAPDEIKASAEDGVLFHLNHPNAKPEDSHNNWMAFKKKLGWVWGEKKDEKAKTHPDIMPYEQLPIETRAKDSLLKAIVDHVKLLGLQFDQKYNKLREELLADADGFLRKENTVLQEKIKEQEKAIAILTERLEAKNAPDDEPADDEQTDGANKKDNGTDSPEPDDPKNSAPVNEEQKPQKPAK